MKRHFVIAVVLFAIVAYPVQSHGLWFQIRFLLFAPILLLHPLMPTRFFIQHDDVHYVGIGLTTLIAFSYTWLIVYVIAKAYVYFKKSRDNTSAM
jgi:hypothetical protein